MLKPRKVTTAARFKSNSFFKRDSSTSASKLFDGKQRHLRRSAETMPPLPAYLLLHVLTGTGILRTLIFGRTKIRGTKRDHFSEHRDRKGRMMMTMMITV